MVNYIFEIDVYGEKTKYSDVVLTSGDINAARFTFVFKKGKEKLDTEGLSLIIKAKRADGIIITDAGMRDGDMLYADVKNSMTEIEGELSFEIALTDSGGAIATVSEIITYVREGYGEANLEAYDTTPVLATLSSRALNAENSAREAENFAKEAKNAAQLAENKTNIFSVSAVCTSGGTATADKSYEEIIEAYETKKFILARITISGKTVETTEIWIGEEICFTAEYEGVNYCIKCNSDNEWSYLETVLAQPEDIPPVDASINAESENPVQNRAVKEYVDDYISLINGTQLRSGTVANAIYWKSGAIGVPQGAAVTNSLRVYTPDFLEYDESVVITVSGDAQIVIFFYTAPSVGACLQNQQTGWLSGTVNLSEYIPEGALYFRISARFMPEGSTNGEDLSGDMSLVSDNVKMERYYEAAPFATLFGLDKKIDDEIGNIETAIDNIIAIQNILIGGEGE